MKSNVCGCCEPPAQLTPLRIENRPGLSAIAYRIGTYSSFRRSMLHAIAGMPELTSLGTRLRDDYAITVLELWATVAHILTFYQERVLNEGFWRTARLRDSLLRMARLIDYQLSPGAAATTLLAFTLEKNAKVKIPIGLRVQSVPGQDEKPQKFETLEAIAADARLNRVPVVPAPIGINPLAKGSTGAFLAPGDDALESMKTLAPGDHFILFSPTGSGSIEELEVRDVRVERDRVILSWSTPIQGAFWNVATRVFKIGRSFRLFGYNAPPQVMVATPDSNVPGGMIWNLHDTRFEYSQLEPEHLVLDSLHKDFAVGSRVLVSVDGDVIGAPNVIAVEELSTTLRSVGPPVVLLESLRATVTSLKISPKVPPIADRRHVAIYELSGPPLRFWGYTYPEFVDTGSVYLPGRRIGHERIEIGTAIERRALQPGWEIDLKEIEIGRRVLLQDARESPVSAAVTGVSLVGSDVTFSTTPADTTTASNLGLLPDQATAITGLISLPLAPFPSLTQLQPKLAVTIGRVGPQTISLALPLNLGNIASKLQAAINAASPHLSFTQTRVIVVDRRVIVWPGVTGADVTLASTALDTTTAIELGVAPGLASAVTALASSPLVPFPVLTAPMPQMAVTVGACGPATISLLPPPATHNDAAAQIETALHTIGDPAPCFSQARVVTLNHRLLVLPGIPGADIQAFLKIGLEADTAIQLEAASAVLLGNVARASHGETVKEEILGNGDAAAVFQQFPLKKKPLTYVPSATPGGVTSSLKVLVNRALWKETPSLYGHVSTAQVHITRIADDGTVAVQFGDGVTGARTFSGRGNIMTVYRHGLGLAGRVRARTLTTLLDRPVGLKSAVNPLAAEGGADPETLDEARENAPSGVRTFGRIVSLRDFEDLATASGEVRKAKGGWVWSAGGQIVHLTVAGQEGGTFSADGLARIHDSLTAARDPNHALAIDNFIRVPVVVAATLHVSETHIAEDVEKAGRAALIDALSFDALRFGQPIHLSDIYRVLQDVPGVSWVTVDLLQFKDQSPAFLASRGADEQPVQKRLRIYPARVVLGPPQSIVPAEQAWLEAPTQDVTLLTSGGLTL